MFNSYNLSYLERMSSAQDLQTDLLTVIQSEFLSETFLNEEEKISKFPKKLINYVMPARAF